ncbi:hypothetical protein [Bacillus sp. T3]|uniref:hypothetical protein n=1 Tax=Bacillus sp. T3 TaxID=467262 RepID=UPI00298119F1|nr:hypothetical protein [Bacillus sp. T3]
MHFSSYREFYPKSLISMGEKDRTSLNNSESSLTHWLVSLEGYPKPNEEYYHWKVSVYPADSGGTFNWNTPLYRSPRFINFDEAYAKAVELEETCQNKDHSMIDFIEKAN